MGNILQGVIPKDQLFNIIKVDLNLNPFGYKSAVALLGFSFCALAYNKSKKLLDDFESLHKKITNIEKNLTTEENRYTIMNGKLDTSNNFLREIASLKEKTTNIETNLKMQEEMNKKMDGKLDKSTELTKNIHESVVFLKAKITNIEQKLKLQKKMEEKMNDKLEKMNDKLEKIKSKQMDKIIDGKIDKILKDVRLLKHYKKGKPIPTKGSVCKNRDPESTGHETVGMPRTCTNTGNDNLIPETNKTELADSSEKSETNDGKEPDNSQNIEKTIADQTPSPDELNSNDQ